MWPLESVPWIVPGRHCHRPAYGQQATVDAHFTAFPQAESRFSIFTHKAPPSPADSEHYCPQGAQESVPRCPGCRTQSQFPGDESGRCSGDLGDPLVISFPQERRSQRRQGGHRQTGIYPNNAVPGVRGLPSLPQHGSLLLVVTAASAQGTTRSRSPLGAGITPGPREPRTTSLSSEQPERNLLSQWGGLSLTPLPQHRDRGGKGRRECPQLRPSQSEASNEV